MDLNDIVVFTKVVETKSFTGAAEQLGLPKSTVSRQARAARGAPRRAARPAHDAQARADRDRRGLLRALRAHRRGRRWPPSRSSPTCRRRRAGGCASPRRSTCRSATSAASSPASCAAHADVTVELDAHRPRRRPHRGGLRHRRPVRPAAGVDADRAQAVHDPHGARARRRRTSRDARHADDDRRARGARPAAVHADRRAISSWTLASGDARLRVRPARRGSRATTTARCATSPSPAAASRCSSDFMIASDVDVGRARPRDARLDQRARATSTPSTPRAPEPAAAPVAVPRPPRPVAQPTAVALEQGRSTKPPTTSRVARVQTREIARPRRDALQKLQS